MHRARSRKFGTQAKFNQLIPYMKEQRGLIAFAIVFSLIGSGVNLVQPLVVGRIISTVQKGDDVLTLALILVAITICSALTNGAMYFVLAKAGEGVVFSARKKLSARLLRLPIQEYDLRRTGDLVSRVGSDTVLLRAALTQGLIDIAGGVLIFIGAVVAMALIDWPLLLMTLMMIASAVAAISFRSSHLRSATTKAQERVGEMSAAVERALYAVRTIRAARAETRESEEIEKDAKQAYIQGVKIARINAWISPVGGLAVNGAFVVVLGVGGYRVATGETEIASLITFILLMFLLIRPVVQFFSAYSSVQSALGALARIQEILDLPLEDSDDERAQPSKRKAVNDTAIEFRNVKFSYPARTETNKTGFNTVTEPKEVIKGVSFKIKRGSRVAVVGQSGAGKSTIFSLMERFYDPTAGEILLDGQLVRTFSRADLRSQIGYVEQDAPVLAGSIKENLLIGSPQATDRDLKRVLAEVNLSSVLKRDKRGLDAEVGEQGIMLSGGERQRLAIARALLAAPPILLLDESTSSLDGLNEQRMREAIDAVANNRTMIVIAHRLSTVIHSDQIIVIDRGKVIGAGSHKQLLRSTPLYKELAATQMLD
jgi:ABC-type multidrug transport system fused ATPase/permease subunit